MKHSRLLSVLFPCIVTRQSPDNRALQAEQVLTQWALSSTWPAPSYCGTSQASRFYWKFELGSRSCLYLWLTDRNWGPQSELIISQWITDNLESALPIISYNLKGRISIFINPQSVYSICRFLFQKCILFVCQFSLQKEPSTMHLWWCWWFGQLC